MASSSIFEKEKFDSENEEVKQVIQQSLDFEQVTEVFLEAKKAFEHWEKLSVIQVEWLNSQIEKLREVRKNVNISNLVGSSVSGFGSILTIAGAALLPVTAGASSALLISGIVVSIAGGSVVAGSNVAEAVMAKKLDEEIKEVTNAFEKCNESLLKLENLCESLKFVSIVPKIKQSMDKLTLLSSVGSVGRIVKLPIRTTGVTMAKVSGALGLICDVANIGATVRNMTLKKNSSSKSEELERIVQDIMRKQRMISRILDTIEEEVFHVCFCLVCWTRIENAKFVTCRGDHSVCIKCFAENCTLKISKMKQLSECPTTTTGQLNCCCLAFGCNFVYERSNFKNHVEKSCNANIDQTFALEFDELI